MQRTSHPFPVTRWSLIARATREGDPVSVRPALDELLRRYLPALRTHLVLSRRLDPDRADDLLQSFVARRVVEQNLLTRAAPGGGKFRTFLLAALNNFLIDQLRAERAAKRAIDGPGAAAPLPDADALAGAGDADDNPARAFEIEWGRQVIARAAELMREECARNERHDMWDVFESRVLAPALHGAEPVSYGQIVHRHGYRTPEQASNVLVSARRAFQRALRDAVAEYVDDESQIDEELRELREVVSRR